MDKSKSSKLEIAEFDRQFIQSQIGLKIKKK
jgi:hypothetical protein